MPLTLLHSSAPVTATTPLAASSRIHYEPHTRLDRVVTEDDRRYRMDVSEMFCTVVRTLGLCHLLPAP
ncbi:hypothetical protein A5780_37140 [Nocardia sp. 852002-20019_SCH5090214]|nr:hypothetical protein A5780_37140 [Nocardia sp. 852002-20019_SCH5090214]